MLTELQPGQEEPNDYKLLVVRDLFFVQSQQWKYQNSMLNLFKVNNKDTRATLNITIKTPE